MTTSSRIHVTTGVGDPLNTVSNRAGDPSVTLTLLIGVRDGGDDDDDAPAVAAAAPDPVTDIMTQSVNHCHYISLCDCDLPPTVRLAEVVTLPARFVT